MCSPLVEIRECKSDTKKISSGRMYPAEAYIADEYYFIMRLFEKMVVKQEISAVAKSVIGRISLPIRKVHIQQLSLSNANIIGSNGWMKMTTLSE